jgi:hypothetical protein
MPCFVGSKVNIHVSKGKRETREERSERMTTIIELSVFESLWQIIFIISKKVIKQFSNRNIGATQNPSVNAANDIPLNI